MYQENGLCEILLHPRETHGNISLKWFPDLVLISFRWNQFFMRKTE